ncbi:lipoprotein insertase outer membrane protein LolB [Endozoicomonas sp. Mp262]|uniref:lipoprotein insertase outer membrane protein LolB n=1 Tax=Endozoicomonas sp. Mp262 TaxID=2919499 RepID=UPI0021DFF6B5
MLVSSLVKSPAGYSLPNNRPVTSSFCVIGAWWTLFRLGFITILVVLSGCASMHRDTAQLSDAAKQQRWQDVQKQLSEIQNWQLVGRLGLKIPGRSGSLSVDWWQHPERFALLLDGPFGQPLAQVQGNRQGVMATVAGESEPVMGPTPDYLMRRITGWDLPVSHLRYWVIGLPVPGLQSRVVLDDSGYPKILHQSGWEVTYLSFRQEKDLRLPSRLRVSDGDIRLTLAINRWNLEGHN